MDSITTSVRILGSSLALFLGITLTGQAQPIRLDSTTPQTQLSGDCATSCLIQGGLRQGGNLFHSFSRFQVEPQAEVRFEDPGVTNILGRITKIGQDYISDIQGLLGVTG